MSDLQVRVISIHALREEGDRYNNRMPRRAGYFYPRPPRGGRRFLLFFFGEFIEISIHALREEGDPVGKLAALLAGISIHALREEGDVRWSGSRIRCTISIHALREEGDSLHHSNMPAVELFLSTPSARRATTAPDDTGTGGPISIHALREEGDDRPAEFEADGQIFLSTPSARRATGRLGSYRGSGRNFYPRPPRGGRRALQHWQTS